MWSLKSNDANELTEQKETHRLRKWTYGCQEEGIVRECGRDVYILLYLKWITNKDHSTWNSAKCWGRMDTSICTAELLHYSAKSITILLIGYTPIQNKKFQRKIHKYKTQLKLNDLDFIQACKIHIDFLISEEGREDWDNYLTGKGNPEGRIKLESGSELKCQMRRCYLQYCSLSQAIFSPKSTAFTMISV